MTRMQFHPLLIPCIIALLLSGRAWAAEPSRYASSDSDSGYVHWIDLYDTNNRKITADSTQPYFSAKHLWSLP